MVDHDAANHQFLARLDEGDAYLSYARVGDDTLDLRHTMVPPDARRRGVGESLVQAAMDYARGHGLRIIPTCPFVSAWLAGHPEARDLVAG